MARNKIFNRDDVSVRYCAFLDILGFGEATLSDFGGVLNLYEELLDMVDLVAPMRPEVSVSIHSDSILLLSDQLPNVIALVQAFQSQILQQDMLVRGGIACGSHSEGQRGGSKFVVSEAIVKAVQVEKTIKWPCVAIHSGIVVPDDWWFSPNQPLLYVDGIRIVSPFMSTWFQSARTRVLQMLRRYPEHATKYNWFLKLHKAVETGEPMIPSEVLERVKRMDRANLEAQATQKDIDAGS